jgi:predicted metal-dependent HD superfamily phosphohydrolase
MGVHDAPQWLLSSFQRSVVGAGGTASTEQIRDAGQALLDHWSTPGRTFHNLKHLTDVLARVDELVEETHEPDLVRLAAWYHGAIFDSADRKAYANRGGEDEIASARLAYDELTALGVPEPRAHRVHDLVVALVRHSPDPADADCAVLCDADLAMLASEPQKYKAYLHDVRAEYAHLPARDFVQARLRILDKLLSRPTLFSSPLGAAWEEPARQNLQAERHRLTKELAVLDAERPAEAEAPHAEPPTAPTEGASSDDRGDSAGRTTPAA